MISPIAEAALRLARSAQHTSYAHLFAPFPPEQLATIQNNLRLPHDLVEWYRTMAPVNVEIPSFGNQPPLYAPNTLQTAQVGYALDARTGERILSWDATWIVFGGEGEYPLIAKTLDTADQAIYYSEVRKRQWQLFLLSTDLEGFLLGLSDYIDLYTIQYNNCICDDDGVMLPGFAADFKVLLDVRPSTHGLGDTWLHGWLGM